MTDMLASIAPKSNQLNADDLLGGRTITVKITKVSGVSGEQPIAINYEGDNNKPYYPCKSMRRVLVYVWGDKGQEYVGRSMTLYCDPTVKFGGLEVGGIRISYMSHLVKEIVMALTASKSNKKPFTVKPLVIAEPQIDHMLEILKRNARDNAINGTAALQTWWGTMPKESHAKLKPFMDEYKKIASENEPSTPIEEPSHDPR